ncbi:MAG: DnaJ domain-containing protein [Neptuniibacter sp.]
MNITQLLFISAMFLAFGMILGKSFKKFNPFFMLLGLIVCAPMIQLLFEFDSWFYTGAFAFGVLSNFGNPFRWVQGSLDDLAMTIQLKKARKRAEENYQEFDEELRNRTEDLQQQRSEAEEQIRRAAEDLKRREQAFKRQQEQFYREQSRSQGSSNTSSNQSSSKSQHESKSSTFDPTKFADACEILGVNPDASFADCKKAYRRLMSVYHPDKINQLTGSRKAQAEEEAKQINVAWETVSKRKKGEK